LIIKGREEEGGGCDRGREGEEEGVIGCFVVERSPPRTALSSLYDKPEAMNEVKQNSVLKGTKRKKERQLFGFLKKSLSRV
jgi:hypothetical protein